MSPRNADFTLLYHYQAGSVPPPAYYEHTIRLAPNGEGEIVFYPDYPQHNPPVWTESFTLSHDELSGLHSLIAKNKLLIRKWRPPAKPSIGGSLESLRINAPDKQVSVPSRLNAKDAADLREVYDALRALVPQQIWDSLRARRQAFEDEYFGHRR